MVGATGSIMKRSLWKDSFKTPEIRPWSDYLKLIKKNSSHDWIKCSTVSQTFLIDRKHTSVETEELSHSHCTPVKFLCCFFCFFQSDKQLL